MSKTLAIIPVELDGLPVPIRAVTEAQRHYLELESLSNSILIPTLSKLADIANAAEDIPVGDITRVTKEISSIKKLQLEFLRIIKELTVDQQKQFEERALDTLIQVARINPDVRQKLGDEVARKYLSTRE